MKKHIYGIWEEPGVFNLVMNNVSTSEDIEKILEKGVRKVLAMLPSQLKKYKPYIIVFILGHSKKQYFDGSMIMRIQESDISTHFKGHTLTKAVESGLKRLAKKVKNLKGGHFLGNSYFPARN